MTPARDEAGTGAAPHRGERHPLSCSPRACRTPPRRLRMTSRVDEQTAACRKREYAFGCAHVGLRAGVKQLLLTPPGGGGPHVLRATYAKRRSLRSRRSLRGRSLPTGTYEALIVPVRPSGGGCLGAQPRHGAVRRPQSLTEALLYVREHGAPYLRSISISDLWSMMTTFITENLWHIGGRTFLSFSENSYSIRVGSADRLTLAETLARSPMFSPVPELTLYPLVSVRVTDAFDSDRFFLLPPEELDHRHMPGGGGGGPRGETRLAPPPARRLIRRVSRRPWIGPASGIGPALGWVSGRRSSSSPTR
jgi:hypothetical protein